jgi:hypothetical protein
MSVTPSSYVVGIFTDRSIADQTIEALYNAGFGQESIRYSASNAGGFFGDLKSIFTGNSTNVDNLASDLSNMGLADEEVQYYTNEYNTGHTIVSVNAPGREREALAILNQYGAYGTGVKSGIAQDAANTVLPSPSYAQAESYPAYDQQNNSVQDSEAQSQIAEEQPLDSYQQNVVNPAPDIEVESTRPVTSEYTSEPYDEPFAATASTDETTDQAPQASQDNAVDDPTIQPVAMEDATTQPIAIEDDNPQDNGETPENETDYQAVQSDIVSPENEVSNQTVQPEVVSDEDDDDDDDTTQLETVVVDNEDNNNEAIEQAPETVSDDTEDTEDSTTQPEVVEVDAEDEAVEQEHETASDDVGDADNSVNDPTTEPVTAVYTSETYTPQDSAVVPPATLENETASAPEQEVGDQTVDTPEYGSADQTELSSDQSTEHEQAVEAPNYNYGADNQEVQTNAFTPEPEAEMQTTPSGKLLPLYTNKLQSYQQQLQDIQQRLQEAKAQLQMAKEHEGQIQQTKQQLDALRAEFEKTQAELDETHARIEQY